MLIFFFLSKITLSQQEKYKTFRQQYNIPRGEDYSFEQCIFTGFNAASILYTLNQEITIQIYRCHFNEIHASGSAFNFNCISVKANISLVAITNCGSSSVRAGAFYIRTTSRNNDNNLPVLQYVTLANCNSNNRLMEFTGPSSNDNEDLRLLDSNFSMCVNDDYGMLYFGDYSTKMDRCSFANNQARVSAIFVEESPNGLASEKSTFSYCNFVYNIVREYGVICTQRFPLLTIDYCVFMKNTLPKAAYSSTEFLVAALEYGTTIHLQNSVVQTMGNYNAVHGGAGGNIYITVNNTEIGSKTVPTYAYTYFSTFGCHADITFYLNHKKCTSTKYGNLLKRNFRMRQFIF